MSKNTVQLHIVVLIFQRYMLSQDALEGHSALFHDAGRANVGNFATGLNAVELTVVEAQVDHGSSGFGGVALAPVGFRDGIGNLCPIVFGRPIKEPTGADEFVAGSEHYAPGANAIFFITG